MTANQLLRAAIHALTPDALSESFVEDRSTAGQITPGSMRLPVEGRLPSFDGAIEWPKWQPDQRGRLPGTQEFEGTG